MASEKAQDRFHYFDVRGSLHRISWGRLATFPSSLLTKLALAKPSNSRADPIKVDRDPLLLDLVIELMRHRDPIYAAHLRKKDEFAKLLDDLEFYRLTDLKNSVAKQLADGLKDDPAPDTIEMVHIDHERNIREISRPLVVVGVDTLYWLDNFLPRGNLPERATGYNINPDGPNLLEPSELALLFDRCHYDVKLFPSEFPGMPFLKKGEVTREVVGRHFRSIGVNHLCLYMPGSGGQPLLVLDKRYSTKSEFRVQLSEFLIAANLVARMTPEHYKPKLGALCHTQLFGESRDD